MGTAKDFVRNATVFKTFRHVLGVLAALVFLVCIARGLVSGHWLWTTMAAMTLLIISYGFQLQVQRRAQRWADSHLDATQRK